MKDDIKIIEKAKKLHKLGKIDEAIKYYKKIIENNKKDPQINYLIGTALLQKEITKNNLLYIKSN